MPLSTLANISVPIPGEANQPLLMPKLQYRFRVLLTGFGNSGTETRELTRQVVDVTRPNLSFEHIPLHVYNSISNIAGKHSWEPVTLTLRDDVNNFVQIAVGQQLQRQFDFWEQRSAAVGSSYKFQTDIEILDGGNGAASTGGPVVLEKFALVGCYIQSANYQSLNYASNEAATVQLTIRYDNAVQYGRDNQSEGVGDQRTTSSRNGSFSTGALQPGSAAQI